MDNAILIEISRRLVAVSPAEIIDLTIEAASDESGIAKQVIKSQNRKQTISDARRAAIYCAKRLTTLSYQKIGDYFGGRDHSTILNACRKHENLSQVDKAYQGLTQRIVKRLSELSLGYREPTNITALI